MTTTPTALDKSKITQTVYTNIYDRLKDTVTSVTITGSTTVTIQTYTGSYNDKVFDTKSNYPILLMNNPTFNWDTFTITKKAVEGKFTVEIFSTQAESSSKFIDAIIDSIETYRGDLKHTGKMSFVDLESTDTDSYLRGSMQIHVSSCTFSFRFIFGGTRV